MQSNKKAGHIHARKQYFLPLLGLGVLCIGVVLVYGYSVQGDIYREAQENIENKVSRSVLLVAQELNRDFTSFEETARLLVKNSETDAMLEEAARYNSYVRVGVVELDGRVSAGMPPLVPAEQEAFESSLSGKNAISVPFIDEGSGRELVTITVPIRRTGEVKAVLAASRDYQRLSDKLTGELQDLNGYAYALDGEGNILFHTQGSPYDPASSNYFDYADPNAPGAPEMLQEMRENLAAGRSGSALYAARDATTGERKLGYVSYARVGVSTDWSVACYVPMQGAAENSSRVLVKSLVLILVLVVLLSVAVWLIVRWEQLRQREVTALSETDPLTGAFSFTKFTREAQRLLTGTPTARYAMLYCDIRGFKLLNDALGYEAGDRVLRYLANCLRGLVRADETFARVAGDNFVLLLTYRRREELPERIEKVYRLMQTFEETHNCGFAVRLCTGIYCIDEDGKQLSVSSMLDRANYAQKTAKNSGLDSFAFYSAEIRETMLVERELESRMESALESDAFEVFYQPKCDPESGRILGAEALVRWRDETHGLLAPAAFIPLFERNHFIARLDQFVFERVCADVANWIADGNEPIPVSVNVSRMQLHNPRLVALYTDIRQSHGLPDGLLELEFTESIIIADMEGFSRTVCELREHGFLCSLDDFGSGYSSLGSLSRLQVDIVKLDQQFFRTTGDTSRGDIVVDSVIAMAHRLNMRTVAEGVEDEAQLERLRRMGCDMIQGYVYAKPLDRAAFEQLLHERAGTAAQKK